MNFIKSIAWMLAKYTSFIIMAYIVVDQWVMGKAKTQALQIEEKVMAVRSADMLHLDKRLDKIDNKLERILEKK